MKQATKPSTEQAVMKALAIRSDATAADLAGAAGLGRSTVGKFLAQLEGAGKVRRVPGGRDGARRLPDRFTLNKASAPGKGDKARMGKATEPPGTEDTKPSAEAAKGARSATRPAARGERLKPGQLDGLVLACLRKHKGDGPLSPTTVARELGRSSGATGNCLKRLAKDKEVHQASAKPLRYSIAGSSAATAEGAVPRSRAAGRRPARRGRPRGA
jgi:hypothetical protein